MSITLCIYLSLCIRLEMVQEAKAADAVLVIEGIRPALWRGWGLPLGNGGCHLGHTPK